MTHQLWKKLGTYIEESNLDVDGYMRLGVQFEGLAHLLGAMSDEKAEHRFLEITLERLIQEYKEKAKAK